MERIVLWNAGWTVTSLTRSPSNQTSRPSRSDSMYSVPVRVMAFSSRVRSEPTQWRPRLQQHLPVLVGGVGIQDDRPTRADGHRAVGDHRGPDDDVEVRGSVQTEPAQRARVDPARAVLQPIDDLHGPWFRRAGHRT